MANMLMFRTLKASEIEVRIRFVKKNGVVLLLYKDARADMTLLDETVGPMNWQRRHSRDNANCVVSIWDAEKKQWIEKEDTGTESNTEAAKGLASDSFKRACFSWGIGRELYTTPFLWFPAEKCKIANEKCNDQFTVEEIEYDEKRSVSYLVIRNTTTNIALSWGEKSSVNSGMALNTSARSINAECKNDIKGNNASNKMSDVVLDDTGSDDIITTEEKNYLKTTAETIIGDGWNRKLRDIAKKYGYTSTENMTRNDFTLILRELEELLPCITDDYDPFGCEV